MLSLSSNNVKFIRHNVSTNASNSTTTETGSQTEVLPVTIYLIISMVSLLINGFIVSLFLWKVRLLRKKPSNCLLFSLSICDFLTAVGFILTSFNILVGGDVPILYRILVDIYEAFLVKTLLFHLCGLTLDRYISLFYALRYETITTHTNVRRFILISWIIPFFASSIQLTWLYKVISGSSDDAFAVICVIDFWFSWISFLLFLALPMILQAFGFISMIREIQKIIQMTPGLDGLSTVTPSEKRAIYVFSLMYLTFLLLAMPYYTIRLWIDTYFYTKSIEPMYDRTVMRFVVALKYSTSIIRPALYGLTSCELRMASHKFKDKVMLCVAPFHQEISRQLATQREMNRNDTLSFEPFSDTRNATWHLKETVEQRECRNLSLETVNELSKAGRSETELTDLI